MNFNCHCNNNQNCCSNTCHCQPELCCCIGPTGPAGPQGPTGPQGATGPTGPTGIATSGAYGTFLHTSQESTIVSGSVPLNSASVYSNLIFNAGGTTVTIVNTGIYNIIYNLYLAQGSSPTEVALLVNGVVEPITVVTNLSFNLDAFGSTTLSLSAGSTIQIAVLSPSNVVLRPGTNAVLNIVQIA